MTENGMKLLRIYSDEAADFGDCKLFEVVASRAPDARMAGQLCFERCSASAAPPTASQAPIEDEPSLVVEIVDDDTRLRAFVAGLAEVGPRIDDAEAVEILGGDNMTEAKK